MRTKFVVHIKKTIYPSAVLCIIGLDHDETMEVLKGFDDVQRFIEGTEACKANKWKGHCTIDDGGKMLLRVVAPLDCPDAFDTLNHEIFHIAHEMFQHIGHKISKDGEPYAYYIGYITKCIFEEAYASPIDDSTYTDIDADAEGTQRSS